MTSGENGEIVADGLEPIDLQEAATTSDPDWRNVKPHEGKVLHGGYVGFKNKASGKYLTIPNGATANGTNVCQQSQSAVANAQEFYLDYQYNPTVNEAFFRIYAVDSSGTPTNVVKTNASGISTANVYVHSINYLLLTERWQFERVSENYYCIYLASNPGTTGTKYALTANTGNGTASGNSTTSAGNVYVTTYTGADKQLWQICTDGKPSDINGIDMLSDNKNGTAYPGEKVSYYYIPKAFNETID